MTAARAHSAGHTLRPAAAGQGGYRIVKKKKWIGHRTVFRTPAADVSARRRAVRLLLRHCVCVRMCTSNINPSAKETAVGNQQGTGSEPELIHLYDGRRRQAMETRCMKPSRARENREWVDSDKIPDNLKNAVVAIEDERFYKHHGVDWVRTIGAVKGWLLGGDAVRRLHDHAAAHQKHHGGQRLLGKAQGKRDLPRVCARKRDRRQGPHPGHVPEHDLPRLQQLRRTDCGDAVTSTRMYRSSIWRNAPCWQVSPTTRRSTTFITIPKR